MVDTDTSTICDSNTNFILLFRIFTWGKIGENEPDEKKIGRKAKMILLISWLVGIFFLHLPESIHFPYMYC